ncbi:DUF500 domain containing protein [Niveomyces insectorum RCEF 264]|uniref:DUF500 domain containing protein n=1 Tax=Niveomyces insectorum RCEF 264 TaxID=1081102 RepID=A0A167XZS0_9HYPO|nr:DUF500 domain containing protein [Niveomyces insectorum RCEF 264]
MAAHSAWPGQHPQPDYYTETAYLGTAPALPPRPSQQHEAPPFPPPPYSQQPPSSRSTGTPGPQPAVTTTDKPTMRERLYQWSVKAGAPVNRLTNKLGAEAFWPSSLDLESDKAARILTSFCYDGFYSSNAVGSSPPSTPGPRGRPAKSLVKIPPRVIQSAAGLAIFTTFRSGLHVSGAGGSGVVVARLPDGRWSPPAGFLVHTLGAGLLVGLDIYDCVCVLRTPAAVRAFTRARVSLGAEVGLVAGPVGAGGAVEAALSKKDKSSPVWCYTKSRGFYAGVQADGTVIVARPDANAAFYGQRGITVEQILSGAVPIPPRTPVPAAVTGTAAEAVGDTTAPWPVATRQLMEALRAAEGRPGTDSAVLQEVRSGPTPGDQGMAEVVREMQKPDEVQGGKEDAETGKSGKRVHW